MDELPQLFDVLRGEMSIIGPRPEDPEIVQKYYPKRFLPVLSAPPGLSSPASLHFYLNCEKLLAHGDAEKTYAEKLLPAKLSMELDYVRNQSLAYDLRIIARTVVAILRVNLGLRNFI
jgi:lipopolysaccharide/colanic/teichoic acid biosynthesis glycosyltransferase